jgi:hypothetical protein
MLYRHGFTPHENALLQMFRARASEFHDAVPMREYTDQWLFLARHAGLPTRLLDWSEGALIALYFALKEPNPVVWMLNPLDLNDLSYSAPSQIRPRQFPLPWHDPWPQLFPGIHSCSLGMTPGRGKSVPRSKTCAELGSRVLTAFRFRSQFIQHTSMLD